MGRDDDELGRCRVVVLATAVTSVEGPATPSFDTGFGIREGPIGLEVKEVGRIFRLCDTEKEPFVALLFVEDESEFRPIQLESLLVGGSI